jgi:hypothetical protein
MGISTSTLVGRSTVSVPGVVLQGEVSPATVVSRTE